MQLARCKELSRTDDNVARIGFPRRGGVGPKPAGGFGLLFQSHLKGPFLEPKFRLCE